jgi:transposase-like protein
LFRLLSHQYKLVVSDQHKSIGLAIKKNFINSKQQWCYNHYKENIRRTLKVRSEDKYKPFMESIRTLFIIKRTDEDFERRLFGIFKSYKEDELALSIIIQIEKDLDKLRAYKGISQAPTTSNIMECFNSHLESRLKSLHKFEDFEHARLWLNGYVMKRRHTKFTNCKGKFVIFNGKRPIENSKKKDANLCGFFV